MRSFCLGWSTTKVPATRSPTRSRSRLNSGKKVNTPDQTSPVIAIAAPTAPALMARKVRGRKTSISRMALRANTASAVSRPPWRAATRRPNTRLPGVAARGPSSKPRNQAFLSRKKPSSHSTPTAWRVGPFTAQPIRPSARVATTRITIITTASNRKAPARWLALASSMRRSTPSGVTSSRRWARSAGAVRLIAATSAHRGRRPSPPPW